MTSTQYDQWSQSTKHMLEPMMELTGITTKLCGEVARENLKAMNDLMQANAEQLQSLSHAKGMEDFMNIQARWAANTTPRLCQHAQYILDALMESASEYSKLFEKGMHQATKEGKNMQEKWEGKALSTKNLHEKHRDK